MKKFLLAAALVATSPVLAAEPPTLVLPVTLINEMANYLAAKPFSDVADMLLQLRQCAAVQTPNAQGVIMSQKGQCDAVREAIMAQKGAASIPTPPMPPSAPLAPSTPVAPLAPDAAAPAPTPAPAPTQTNDGSKKSPG